MCVDGRDPAAAARARRRARRAHEPVLQRRLMRITAIEARRYRVPLDPPFRAAWDPVPRDHQEATLVARSHRRRASTGCGERRRTCPTARCSSRLSSGSIRFRTEVVRELVRDGRLSRRAAVDRRGRRLGSGRQVRRRSRAGSCSAAAPSGCSRTRRAASCVEPGGARRAAASRCATRGVKAVKIRFHHADWRDDVEVVAGRARRGRVGPRDHGRREPGLAHAGRPRAPAGTSRPRRRCARALEPLGVYWLEEPLRTDDVEGYAALRAPDEPAARGGRDGAHGAGGARPRRSAAASTCSRRTSSFARRHRRLPPRRRARRSRRARLVAAHLVERLRPASRTCTLRSPFSTVPVRRGAVRPAGLVGRAARLAAAGAARDRRRRDDRAAGRARASASSPISTRSSAGGSADADPGRRPARAGDARSSSRRSSSTRRRRRRCSCASPPQASATPIVHLADGRARRGPLADGARARRRGSRRGGRRGRHPRRPGRPCRVLLRPVVPHVPRPAAPAGSNLCAPAGENALAGTLMDGTIAPPPPGRDDAPARPDDGVLRRAHGRRRRRRRADPGRAAALAGGAARLRRRSPASAPSATSPRVAAGRRASS